MKKRILAMGMAFAVCFTSSTADVTVCAMKMENEQQTVEPAESVEADVTETKTEATGNTETEVAEAAEKTETTETVEDTETTETTEDAEITEMTEGTKTTEATEDTETTETTEETETTEATEDTETIKATEETETTETTEETETTETTEEEETEVTEMTETEISGGYIPLPMEDDVDVIEKEDIVALGSVSSYKTENLPSIRDQNPYGTCWAFSATALAELSILQNESGHKAADMDFSELHLAYFTDYSVTDPLGGTEGDSNTLQSSSNFLDVGGNLLFAKYAYANWMGAADESVAPYDTAYTVASTGLDENIAYTDVAHLKNAYTVNLEEDRDAAKALIQELGGISVSYCATNSDYDLTHNSFYSGTNNTANHAVTVVGWDDDFPKEDFATTAPGDGAWLIRNSWGVDDESYYGYF